MACELIVGAGIEAFSADGMVGARIEAFTAGELGARIETFTADETEEGARIESLRPMN